MAVLKLVIENRKLWFTSDTHYSHSNICLATTKWENPTMGTFRDFSSLEEMNNAIVNNINEVVGEDDILVHLGDWSFGGFDKIREFRERLFCKNIHLVLGNHDQHIQKNKENIRNIFSTVNDYLYLDIRIPMKMFTKKYRVICFHHPIASWDGVGDGSYHLYGHLHSKPENRINDGRCMDVGVDGNNLYPVLFDDIIEKLRDKPKVGFRLKFDHHEKG
jgi:calcineurin-like phosphoesterase family protein